MEFPGGNANSPKHLICSIDVFGHTNLIAYKPLPSQAFDAHVVDEDGKQVQKYFFGGGKYGQSLKPDDELLDPAHHVSLNTIRDERTMDFNYCEWANPCWTFDVFKVFNFNKAGWYHLQVQVGLFRKDTNGIFQPFSCQWPKRQL